MQGGTLDGAAADSTCAHAPDSRVLVNRAQTMLLERFREKRGWTYRVDLRTVAGTERPGVCLSFLVPDATAVEAASEAAKLVSALNGTLCSGSVR